MDTNQASVQLRGRSSYDAVRGFKEGQAVIAFGERVVDVKMFYSNPGFAKAMRVTRYVALPPPDEAHMKHIPAITKLRDLMVKKGWTAMRADVALKPQAEITAMTDAMALGFLQENSGLDCGLFGVAAVYGLSHPISLDDAPIDPAEIVVAEEAKQPPGDPANAFPSKPVEPDKAVSFHELGAQTPSSHNRPASIRIPAASCKKLRARPASPFSKPTPPPRPGRAAMPQSNSREQGSALLYVFIGLILFTGLVFTFSKSFQNSNDLSSPQQGKIAANDILSYTTDISQTVTKLITKGCSENDISFENPVVTGYTNPGCAR